MPENVPPYGSQQMPPYPPNYYPRRRKSRWWIPVLIIGIILTVIIIFFVALFGMIGAAFQFEDQEVNVSDNTVLHLTLSGMSEVEQTNPFAFLAGGDFNATYTETLDAIKRAKTDKRVKGIFINPTLGAPLSKAVELNKALKDFKESGKFIYAHMDIAEERQLFASMTADSIFMPREGITVVNGFGISSLFFKGLMDEIGVDFYVEHFEEYKTAAESFTSRKFSEPSKEQLRAIIMQSYNAFVDEVSTSRKISREKVESLINTGIYSVDELKSNGIIDDFATESQVKEFIKKRVFGKEHGHISLITPGRYIESDYEDNSHVAKGKKIAIIYGEGAINSGGGEAFMANENEIRADRFVKYLRQVRDDKDIKAVILRINSPGGTVIASDEIYQEVLKLKAKKPVYASMADVAASGGYYISMAADTIIAHPETITGSIGVVAMIPNLSGLIKKIYLDSDTINANPNAQFMNPFYPFQDKDKEKLHLYAKQTYDRFVSKVASNRKMSFENTRNLAKGRVWTGEAAKRLGLVDELGGLQKAIDIAKARIGVKKGEKVEVEEFPKDEDSFEAFIEMFTGSGKDEEVKLVEKIAVKLKVSPEQALLDWKRLPESARKQIAYSYQLMEMSKKGSLYAMPYLPVVE